MSVGILATNAHLVGSDNNLGAAATLTFLNGSTLVLGSSQAANALLESLTGAAKGSLAVRGAATWALLAVGGNGTSLQADSTQALGVKWVAASSSGFVTNTGGALTANALVLGAGTNDTKVAAGLVTDGASVLTLGVAGGVVGGLVLKNATSGTITINPTTGALSGIITVPAVTGTLLTTAAAITAAQGGTGQSSYTVGDMLYASTTTALSKLAAVAAGQVIISQGTGTAPVWSAQPVLTPSQAANTVVDGLILLDGTAASAANQQYSPAIRLSGQGWKTTATAASQQVDWRFYAVPVQGAANPSGLLVWSTQINGAGYNTKLTLSSGGNLGLTGTLTVAGGDVTNILVSGATMGLRVVQSSAGSTIEGVDSTGIGSFQPLFVGGSTVTFTLSSTTKATLASGGLAVVNGFGCNGTTAQSAFASGGAAPAGGTGTAAGGWDTAGHRDSAITLLNNIRSALVANGIMS